MLGGAQTSGPKPKTPDVVVEEIFDTVADELRRDPTRTVSDLLPLVFTLRGRPYSLEEHWLFDPLFRLFVRPKMTVVMAARQTGKTQNISAADSLDAALNEFTNILLVTPLYEQARRWSTNYVKPILDGCIIPGFTQVVGKAKDNDNVLQRGFPNGSNMLFSFAFLDCERVRGVSASRLGIDEVQGINPTFIDIIREVLSGSKLGFERYTGTPKTKVNTLHGLFMKTSMAAWAIKCTGCNYENIFNDEGMLGCIGKKGPICRKCGKAIHPATGYYVHAYPEKQWRAVGYQVPQIVHPLHYAIPHKWKDILYKRENMRPAQFANECLALSSDVGASLITLDDIQACAKIPHRTLDQVRAMKPRYKLIVSATDWGGRGKKKNARKVSDDSELMFSSYTANAVVGLTHDNEFEVLYLSRLPHDMDPTVEVQEAIKVFFGSGADIWAYDATGAGEIRVTMGLQTVIDAGLQAGDIMPIRYAMLGPKKPILYLVPPTRGDVQYAYDMDKTRACLLVAFMIGKHILGLPEYEPNKALLHDFLAWYEDTQELFRRGKVTTIQRDPNLPDDVAQAVTMAVCALCHATKGWPDLASYVTSYVSSTMDGVDPEEVDPTNPDWSDQN
jgi:hypothetical protein